MEIIESITLRVDLLSLVFLLGAAQGLFLVLALVTIKHGSRRANRYLALFILTFSITLVDYFLEYTRYYSRMPWLLGVIWPSNYLYGPFLLFYAKSLVQKHWLLTWRRSLIHFWPFVLSIVVLIPLFMLPETLKVQLFFGNHLEQVLQAEIEAKRLGSVFAVLSAMFVSFTTVIQIGIYLLILIAVLRQHTRHIKDEFSYADKISLTWLRYLTVVVIVLWLLFAFAELFAEAFQIEEQSRSMLHALIAIFIYAMGYFGIRQPEIFKEQDGAYAATAADDNSATYQEAKKDKYQKSSLSQSQAQELAQQLKEHMQVDKLYLDSDLTLPILSQALNTSPHALSQAINEQLQKNFFDFVNEYRIDEARHRLEKVEKGRMNVYAIALDSGFRSKSAFYSAFKRFTGMTPSEYREQV